MTIDEPRLKAEADHREMVSQIEQLLRSSGVALLDRDYWYEGFGSWTLRLSRGGRQYQVGFDGREGSLGFKVLYDGVPARNTPELAEERLERLGPETPQQVLAFTIRQIDRTEAGEFVLSPPVVSERALS
jgi:hypothetical protein